MISFRKTLLLLGFAGLWIGCEGRGTSESLEFIPSPPSQSPPVARTAEFSTIFSVIIQPRCLKCHKSMKSEEALIDRLWIVPGDLGGSDMYTQSESGQMPPRGPKVPAEDLELLRAYIERLGASNGE